MRYTSILSLIILLSSLSLISTEVLYQPQTIPEVEIVKNADKMRSLGTLLDVIHDLQSIFSQVKHTRNTVSNHSRETIEIFDKFNKIKTSKICGSCQKFVTLVRKFGESDRVRKIAESAAKLVCRLYYKKEFCNEIIDTYGDIVYESLIDRNLNAKMVCQRFRMCPRTTKTEKTKQYVQEVLKDKPQTNIPVPTKQETYKILHLTDPHIDLLYEIGANAFCSDPFCCRPEYGFPTDPSKGAQYWGTVGPCDIPVRTFEQFLMYTSQNLKVDMIIWTGDNIAHDIWQQSKENQTLNTLDATILIQKYFPNTTVYPMFGNHEPFPADQLDLFGNKSDWLMDELTDMWKDWLDQDAIKQLKTHTYYATVNTKYNVKVIALDTQVCDVMNFYLIRDPSDPLKHLEWLRDQLYDSERKNQGVILMAHIPPGDWSCDSEWGARYRALVDRFTNIIRGQFFGHTHQDQFQVVRSYKDSSPVGTYLIAPSFSTYSEIYPSFRIFDMDAKTNQPLDYSQYRLDLNKWNLNKTGPIDFDLAYTFLKEYNLPDMSYGAFDTLAERIKSDPNTAARYAYNFETGANQGGKLKRREIHHFYCTAKHSVAHDMIGCLGLDASVLDLILFATSILPGSWHFDKC